MDINYAADDAYTAKSYNLSLTPGYQGNLSVDGNLNESFDENDDTDFTGQGYWGNGISIMFTVTSTFNKSHNINRIKVVYRGRKDPDGLFIWMAEYSYYFIEAYYNGKWNILESNTAWAGVPKATFDKSTGWNNVGAVRIRMRGTVWRQWYDVWAYLDCFELQAWGPPPYIDIGIRVRKSGETIKIGAQELDGHKLRIRKGSTTYGIPLLVTSDPSASGLRMYDGSVVKALPKVD